MHHDSFKLNFPLPFSFVFCLNHNLNCSFVFSNHFKVLSVLQESNRYLLRWNIQARSLDTKPRLLHHSLILHYPRRHQPKLPLHILRTIQHRSPESLQRFLFIADPIKRLGQFTIYLPPKFFTYIIEYFILTRDLILLLFLKPKILEPKRTVFVVVF